MDSREHAARGAALTRLRIGLLGVVVLGVLCITPFRPLKISGRSMEPTMRGGETYLLDQFYWRLGGLRRNDVVVVRHQNEQWVKRLIGLPGDRLQITTTPSNWITSVENLTVNPTLEVQGPGVETRTMGPGEIFVIGDNINNSFDSTVQEAGTFREADILGVVQTFTLRRDFPFRRHL